MSSEVSVVALVRGEEQYIFMFNESNRTETLRMLGRYAADPELSFTWYDAAVLSQRIRELMPAESISSVQKKGNNPSCTHTFHPPATPKKTAANPQPRFRFTKES